MSTAAALHPLKLLSSPLNWFCSSSIFGFVVLLVIVFSSALFATSSYFKIFFDAIAECVCQVSSGLVLACVCVCDCGASMCKMRRLCEQLCCKVPLTDMLCWSGWVCMPVCLHLYESVCVAWRWVTILWLPPGLTERIQGSPGWGHHAQVKVLYLGPGKPTYLLPTSYLPACRPLATNIAPHHTSDTHQHTCTQAERQLSKRGKPF